MNISLEMVATFVAIVGGFKALEWVIEKINNKHDKDQQIDSTEEDFKAYKIATDAKIENLQTQLNNAHNYAQSSMDGMKKEIVQTLTDHREEYMQGINEVKASLSEMSSIYKQTVSLVELKIDNLEKTNTEHLEALKVAQNKHNNLMERTFICEKEISVLQNREKVSEKRLADLEEGAKKNEK